MLSDIIKLTPGFIIYVNGIRIPPVIEMAVKHIRVTGRVNALSSFSISIADPERMIVDNPLFFIGSQIKILMGHKDMVEEVAIYELTGMKAYFNSESGVSVILEGCCHLHRLNHARVNRSYTEKNMPDIVNQIGGLYSLSVDTDVETPPKPFIFQKGLTDFEYLLMKTREHNCYLWGYDKKLFFRKETDAGSEEIVLERGKTLTSFTGGAHTGRLYTNVVVRGRDSATGKFIEAAALPDKVKKKLGGDTPAPAYIEKNIAKYKHYYYDNTIKDKKGAEERAALILEQNSMEYVRYIGECQGNPKIKAGMTITIKGMGEFYSGKYLVMQAEHELIPEQGYTTSFEAVRNSTTARKGKQQWVPATGSSAKKKGKLKPEFSNLQWMQEGKSVKHAMIDDEVTLSASAKNMENGSTVTIKIYEKDYNNPDDFVAEITGDVKSGKATATWVVEYVEDTDDENSEEEMREKGYTLPEYVFTVETGDGEVVSKKGPLLEIKDWIEIELEEYDGNPAAGVKYVVSDMNGKKIKEGTLDANGYAKVEEIGVSKRIISFPDLKEKGINVFNI